MNKSKVILLVGLVLFVFPVANLLQAQHIIEQIEYELPINYDLLPEDVEFDDPASEARYFLNLPEEVLKESALRDYGDIEIIKSTIYIDGENFAMESESNEEGKTLIILDHTKTILYYVLWSQKKIFEMSKEDMEEMRLEAEAVVQEILDQLPPDMREQARASMEEEKKRMRAPGQVESTGKSMKKYGYECDQYMIESDDKIIAVWATDDKSGLSKIVRGISDKLSDIFPDEDEEEIDEWKLLPGKIPIEVRLYRLNQIDMPKIEIQAITGMKATKPPAEIFIPPGASEGFTKSSMKELMHQMMEMMPDDEEY